MGSGAAASARTGAYRTWAPALMPAGAARRAAMAWEQPENGRDGGCRGKAKRPADGHRAATASPAARAAAAPGGTRWVQGSALGGLQPARRPGTAEARAQA